MNEGGGMENPDSNCEVLTLAKLLLDNAAEAQIRIGTIPSVERRAFKFPGIALSSGGAGKSVYETSLSTGIWDRLSALRRGHATRHMARKRTSPCSVPSVEKAP